MWKMADEIKGSSSRPGLDPSKIDFDAMYFYENMGFVRDGGCIIVVENIPQVPCEKLQKLENVIRTIYSQIGVIKEAGLWIPVDDNGRTLGYCFIEFNSTQEAQLAKKETSGSKFYRSHKFVVNMFKDFMKVPDKWAPPEKKEYIHGDVSMRQERERRRLLKEEWDNWVQKRKKIHEELRLARQQLRDGEASDKEDRHLLLPLPSHASTSYCRRLTSD